MCGRYTLYGVSDRELRARYHLAATPAFPIPDNYNVAPRQRLPVIVEHEDGQRAAELMQWGFMPPWSTDPAKGLRPINTKAETAWESPLWRQAVRRNRALIPARGFYEWQSVDSSKVPYYIHQGH